MEMCKFYEIDIEAKAEADAMDAMLKEMDPEGYKISEEMAASECSTSSIPEIIKECCSKSCKWFSTSDGFPGETCYCCDNPDCPHNGIIHIEFDESAVI